jgi:hypothetical protein
MNFLLQQRYMLDLKCKERIPGIPEDNTKTVLDVGHRTLFVLQKKM